MLLLMEIGIVLILLTLPWDKETRKGLFQLLALLITDVITLSSTTFASNAKAGFMLPGIQSFRLGDFLLVETQFGRVNERGFFSHRNSNGRTRPHHSSKLVFGFASVCGRGGLK